MRRAGLLAAGAALVLGAGAAGLLLPVRQADAVPPVTVDRLSWGSVGRSIALQGRVDAARSWDLLSPADARLRSVDVELGAEVAAGQALVTLAEDEGAADARLGRAWLADVYPVERETLRTERAATLARHAKAQAAVDAKARALRRLGRGGAAADAGAVGAEATELRGTQAAELAAIDGRAAALEQQRLELSLKVERASSVAADGGKALRAPFAGVVTAVSVEPEAAPAVARGQHILTVVEGGADAIRVAVAADQTLELVRARRARCTLPRRGTTVPCALQGIEKGADGLVARYRLPGGRADAATRGEPADISVEVGAPTMGVTVARSALRYRNGRVGLVVRRPEGPVFVAVAVLVTGDDRLVVRGAVKPGDVAIVDG